MQHGPHLVSNEPIKSVKSIAVGKKNTLVRPSILALETRIVLCDVQQEALQRQRRWTSPAADDG